MTSSGLDYRIACNAGNPHSHQASACAVGVNDSFTLDPQTIIILSIYPHRKRRKSPEAAPLLVGTAFVEDVISSLFRPCAKVNPGSLWPIGFGQIAPVTLTLSTSMGRSRFG